MDKETLELKVLQLKNEVAQLKEYIIHLKQDIQQTIELGDKEGAEILKGVLHGEEMELLHIKVLLSEAECDLLGHF